ncbi:hypothetical protein K7X08_016197 [Anisodus acutangulus]|uniref:Telomere length regulation protein conserved domain-containing protein n=1 Tax=Anisodus acutangulus TaxID=402998 RepID=A0A9Q1R1W9_9SOLA|nr:hypothetical protein K7X08_016197 [Anisodus acutangulus]
MTRLIFFSLPDVAYDWLACLPISARMHVYDVFFLRGQVIEIAQELFTYCREDLAHGELKQIISGVVQLLTSIPDKAQAGSPKALSSHMFFKHITTQLLAGAHEWDKLSDGGEHVDKNKLGGALLSMGEAFACISRRGSADITAALGLCLEKMSKEDLDAIKDALHCILEGVSCRLESADHLIRKMASSVALAFSKVIDPQNPLYLDDSCRDEAIDWDFGLLTPEKRLLVRSTNIDGDTKGCSTTVDGKVLNTIAAASTHDKTMSKKKKLFVFESLDPDEIIDPASLNNEVDDDEDNASETFESLNDSSLQPYDLSDDDADLKRNFSQLVDVIGALRKSNDADGVDKAIDVAEKLVRASPDELKFLASDLTRSLIQVRCSDLTIEGEEESAEEETKSACCFDCHMSS